VEVRVAALAFRIRFAIPRRPGSSAASRRGFAWGFHRECVSLAVLVQRFELAVMDGYLTGMLDPDLPVRRFGQAAEAAPVHHIPLIDARRTGTLDLLGAGAVGLDQPVDILRAETLGVVDVELAPLESLGVFPVDLLTAGLDNVEVQI